MDSCFADANGGRVDPDKHIVKVHRLLGPFPGHDGRVDPDKHIVKVHRLLGPFPGHRAKKVCERCGLGRPKRSRMHALVTQGAVARPRYKSTGVPRSGL